MLHWYKECGILPQVFFHQKRTTYTPSWVKIKYGAWYLNPSTWKKRKVGEPLEDPKQQQESTLSEAKAESEKLVCGSFYVGILLRSYPVKQMVVVPYAIWY